MTTPKQRKRRPGNAKKAVAYLRVSTTEECLDAQRDAIEAWAKREKVRVVAWCEDHGVSGAAPLDERGGLMEAMDAIEAHRAGLFVVAKHDRLARSTMVAGLIREDAEKLGATYVSACGSGNGDDPEAMLMRGLLALCAQ